MRGSFLLTCLALFALTGAARAETIDVQIKGIDDGIKTTQQQDYKEAVLFAKREAIERAGVKISARSQVKNFVLDQDYIESQAEALLLPGYQIVDMGYSAEGIYQVVLIGRIEVGGAKTAPAAAKDLIQFGGHQWRVISGKWAVRDGQLSVEENAGEALLCLVPVDTLTNYTLEIDVEPIQDGGLSIHLRSLPLHGSVITVEDDNICSIGFNFYPTQSQYNLFLRRKGVQYGRGMWEKLEPTWVHYQRSALFTGKSNAIKVVARGGHYRIYVNGVLLTQFWEESNQEGTLSLVAFEKSRYRFSNVKISP
jgi:hypothetical protein